MLFPLVVCGALCAVLCVVCCGAGPDRCAFYVALCCAGPVFLWASVPGAAVCCSAVLRVVVLWFAVPVCLRCVALCLAPLHFWRWLVPGIVGCFRVFIGGSVCLVLSSGGVCWRWCPCLAAWAAALLFGVLVWFAVVSCSLLLCAVVLCCRVVLRCRALLSCFFCALVFVFVHFLKNICEREKQNKISYI